MFLYNGNVTYKMNKWIIIIVPLQLLLYGERYVRLPFGKFP